MKLPGETTLTLHGRANGDERNTTITKPCSKQRIEDADSKHAAGQCDACSLHWISKGRLLASSRGRLQRAGQCLRLPVQALQGALVGVPCREHVDTGSSPRVSKMKKLLVLSIVREYFCTVSHCLMPSWRSSKTCKRKNRNFVVWFPKIFLAWPSDSCECQ